MQCIVTEKDLYGQNYRRNEIVKNRIDWRIGREHNIFWTTKNIIENKVQRVGYRHREKCEFTEEKLFSWDQYKEGMKFMLLSHSIYKDISVPLRAW